MLLRSELIRSLAGAALLIGGALLLPLSARAERIATITILGNAQSEERLILEGFGLAPGDEYDPEKVRTGIRNLHRQGLFQSIQVEGEPTPEGLRLVIRVQENPILLQVRYEGTKKLKDKDFEEVVQLAPGQLVTRQAVERARRDILELYESKGYLLAEVEAEIRGDRRADVIFRIKENEKVQVKKILFEGNKFVSSDDLRDAMETKEDRWYRGGDFKRDVFEEDQARIVSRLGEAGFVDGRVVETKQTFDDKKEKLTLTIVVEEGPRYSVGTIALHHNDILPDERVRRAVTLVEGKPFNTVKFEETTQNLYALYQEEGHIYAAIEPKKVPREGNVIDLQYQIDEREPARIQRVIITGNTRTHDRVIRREMLAAPGDIFKRSKIVRSQREIFQLGFFEDIQLDSKTADRSTGDIDLIMKVEERRTGQANVGAGINSQSGLTGFLQLSENNFLGRGQSVAARAEFGRFRELELSFTEPWLFGTPTSAGIDIFDTRRRFDEYTEKRRGGDLRLGRPFPWLDYTNMFWRYSLAEYRLDAEDAFEAEVGDQGPSTISSTTWTLSRNSVDSPFFPTQGSAHQLVNEFAGGILGGDETYYSASMTTKSYFRTVGKLVLSLSGRVGTLVGLRDPDDVPFWKRFRLGGIAANGLRGYGDYEIVPDQRLPSTGGRSMLITKSEFRYPIGRSVQALSFFDLGNTWRSPGEMDLTDLRRGAGFGVRIDVPMIGQIGFDYGYGFDRTEREGGPGWEFHFQLGGSGL
jgi:outer membrane protein insertion porin family